MKEESQEFALTPLRFRAALISSRSLESRVGASTRNIPSRVVICKESRLTFALSHSPIGLSLPSLSVSHSLYRAIPR